MQRQCHLSSVASREISQTWRERNPTGVQRSSPASYARPASRGTVLTQQDCRTACWTHVMSLDVT